MPAWNSSWELWMAEKAVRGMSVFSPMVVMAGSAASGAVGVWRESAISLRLYWVERAAVKRRVFVPAASSTGEETVVKVFHAPVAGAVTSPAAELLTERRTSAPATEARPKER